MQKYSVNHDDIDFKRQQYERPHEYKWLTWWQKQKICISLFIYDNFALAVLLGGTIFFVWLVFGYALPKASG
ncbi:hypothetical protein [Acidocella sp.]|uniref:hypothetical protein n=1 Tax=Acidocella sp. TaxID=50710 RepID=UPI0038CF554E